MFPKRNRLSETNGPVLCQQGRSSKVTWAHALAGSRLLDVSSLDLLMTGWAWMSKAVFIPLWLDY